MVSTKQAIGFVAVAVAVLVVPTGRSARVLAQSTVPVAEFVADIRPGTSGSGIGNMRVFQNALYFSANDGVHGNELWRLDTTGVPFMVADIVAGTGSSSPAELTAVAGKLYFTASTPAEGRELWQYDGVSPPSLVADIYPGPVNGDLLYLTAYGNQLVFRANDSVHGDELFVLDDNGLRLVNIALESPSCPAPDCYSSPYGLVVYGGILYFGAADVVSGFEVFSFDGSVAQPLTDLPPGGPTGITGLGTRLVFGAIDFGQYRLFSYDLAAGGAGTKISDVVVSDTLFTSGRQPVAFNNLVYFPGNDGSTGQELWVTDGTAAGTHLFQDLYPGPAASVPRWLTVFNGELYFGATNPTSGNEPRALSGATLRLVADLNPGTGWSSFNMPAILGGFLVFEANGADGHLHPWFTQGTAATTQVIRKSDGALINSLFDSIDDPHFTFFNGALYFPARDEVIGTELWRITLSAAPTTTTSLTSSKNPSLVGESITLTAVVTGANPNGSVAFLDGVTPLGTVALAGGTAQMTLSTLGGGSHTITARYSGDAGNAPSTSADLIQVVDKIPTITSLSSSQPSSVYGQTVTFTATVTGGTPTGDVTFFDGATALATVAIAGNSASFTTQTLAAGAHTFTATYLGDAIHALSTSNAVLQTVGQVITTTTVTSSPNPSIAGGVVTFSAAVSGGAPVGSIVFSDGAVTLATVAMVGGAASFQTSTLSIGSHVITASYAGDANHVGSASSVTHVVNDPAPPTPPVANSQNVITSEDTPTPITLTGSDVNNDPLTFQVTSLPIRGTLSGTAPNLIYTPGLNYSGLDSFSFKVNDGTADSNIAIVNITVTPVNDAPVAVNDAFTTLEDAALVVSAPGVLGNDTDVEGNGLSAILVTGPLHGAVTLAATGAFTYTPSPNFSGQDAFTYRANDGALNSNVATVTIGVTPVNDPPLVTSDSYSTTENVPLTVAMPGVLSNDSDPEGAPLTAALVSGPANGTLTLNSNGSFTYTPSANFTGVDSFTYRATDGATSSGPATVSITVVPSNVTWAATGSLGARRRYHTATLLTNGKVLVTGGYSQGNNILASAELYNPVTGTWSATGNMGTRRAFHTATLLVDGHVLVAGGESNVLLNRAETYDPATGNWTAAGNLSAFHSRHSATLLQNGSVLVVGGYDNSGSYPYAEVYSPATRTWSMTNSLSVGRHFHTATRLNSGSVLVVGGYGTGGAVNSVELYDFYSGTWSTVAPLATNRTGHTATQLPSGKVLVTGGGNNSSQSLATTELYDPASATWTLAASLSTVRIQHSATLLASGKVLVAGGYDSVGAPLASSELYNPATGQWSPTASLIAARFSHTATVLADGRVLAVGGIGASGALASAEQYGPLVATGASWTATGSLNTPTGIHIVAPLPNDKVLVAGSGNGKTTELYDPLTGKWALTGSLNIERPFFTATALADGRVLAVGGLNATGYMKSAEIYNPATGSWSFTGNLATGRAFATATLLSSGKVLVAGGDVGGATNTVELYDPNTGSWTTTGSMLTGRYLHTATRLNTGQVLVVGGFASTGALATAELFDPATGLWSAVGSLHSRRIYHTATKLADGRVLVAGGIAQNNALDTAEIYNPATRTWTSTPKLADRRELHTATLLPDGKVLIAGGDTTAAVLSSAELYDPTTGLWTQTATMIAARSGHASALLSNGKVLVAGGWGGSALLATAEVYKQ